MPTYGYRCSRGHHFEVLQRITDAPISICLECQAPATRVFYPVGIIFRGQGFYKTDSRGSDTAVPTSKPEGAKPESAKTETKGTQPVSPSKASPSETASDRTEHLSQGD